MPEGATSATFAVTAEGTGSHTSFAITGVYENVSHYANIEVKPA